MAERMSSISKHENYWTLTAVFKNKVVGYIGLIKNYFWEQEGEYIKIQALVVDDKYKNIGVGMKLIAASEVIAKQQNIYVFVLNCSNKVERNTAHQFYPKLGFEAKSTGYIKIIS